MFDKGLETFLVVAECGSFSRAAEKLYVSRAALIQQINLLEEKLGFRLFFRSNRGVTLTNCGSVYYEEIEKLLERHRQIVNNCLNIQNSETVRIGLLPNFPSTVLPVVCRIYRERFPKRLLKFVEYPLDQYFKAFNSGAFDITAEYIRDLNSNSTKLVNMDIMRSVPCIGVPHDHPLASARQLSADMLNGYHVMMYHRGISQSSDRLRSCFERSAPYLIIVGFDCYTSYLDTYCNAFGDLLVFCDAYETNFPGLIKKPLKLDEDISVPIGIGYHREHSPYVDDFLDIVEELFLPAEHAKREAERA